MLKVCSRKERRGEEALFVPDEGLVVWLAGVGVVEVAQLVAGEALHLPLQVRLGRRHRHVAVGVDVAEGDRFLSSR